MNNAINQLIILGNGFDLECGLPSRFADFFNERDPHLDEWLEADKNGGKSHYINIWDFIFREEKKDNPSWADVESIIQQWVETKLPSLDQDKRSFISRFIAERANSNIGNINEALTSWKEDIKRYGIDSSAKLSLHEQAVIADASERNADADYMGRNCLDQKDFLFLQLREMELAFEEYLQRKMDDRYQANAWKLYQRLCSQDLDSTAGQVNNYVITFNFTKITTPNDVSPNELGYWRHVHGIVGEHNLIFGVDRTQLFVGDTLRQEVLQFTKTERVLESPVDHPRERSIFGFSKDGDDLSFIKFYGHSLGKADYSYFKSIFDKVDLFDSDTTLIFYYPSDRPQERNTQYEQVIELLTHYGNEMIDQKRGQNFMHRLLLEDRLKLVELNVADLHLRGESSSPSMYMSRRQQILMNAVQKYEVASSVQVDSR